MMPRRRGPSTAAAIALGATALACVAPEKAPGTVVYASGADLESANPLVTVHTLSRQVQRYALFVTLARWDDSLRAVPYAAKGWRWEDGGRALVFTLHDDVRWHDGRPTTAGDAAFTLEAARDPATGFPRHADLAGVVAAEARDDTTLVVRFATPPPGFPPVLCELPLLPAHLLSEVPRDRMRLAAYSLAPVGNGPFRFDERRAGQRWVFVRNGDFPAALGGPPRLERLVIAVVDEATTKFAGLVSGELHTAGIAPTSAAMAARDSTLRVLDYPLLLASAIVFNTQRPPFDDARVRRAIALSVDRDRLVSAALAGFAAPAAGPVPPESPFALPASPARDTRRADSLLDAAGWRLTSDGTRARGGRPLAIELLTVGSADNAVEQLLQADLAARGILVSIRQLEFGAFLAAARGREKRFDALVTGIPGDLSLAWLSSMYDSRLAGGALDYGGYHTPALDALLARARAASDPAAQRLAWQDVQRELAREAPAAWLYHSRGVQGISRRLRGVRMDLRGELVTLHDWSLDGDSAPPVAAAR